MTTPCDCHFYDRQYTFHVACFSPRMLWHMYGCHGCVANCVRGPILVIAITIHFGGRVYCNQFVMFITASSWLLQQHHQKKSIPWCTHSFVVFSVLVCFGCPFLTCFACLFQLGLRARARTRWRRNFRKRVLLWCRKPNRWRNSTSNTFEWRLLTDFVLANSPCRSEAAKTEAESESRQVAS